MNLLQDVRFGLRTLLKGRGFTLVALATLMLGIGASVAIFSIVNSILLRPVPFPNPDELVEITAAYPPGAFVAMRAQSKTMNLAAFNEDLEFNLTGEGNPVHLRGTAVSANFFSVLSVGPEAGRFFETDEDKPGRDQLVILSHILWQRKFRGDPRIVGRSLMLNGISRQVVGVMPATFRFPSAETELWVPLRLDPGNPGVFWGADYMPLVGWLRPGATLEQARTELRTLQPQVVRLFPWKMPANWNADSSVVPLQQAIVGDVQPKLLICLAGVGLVLLMACANVSNLLLARAGARQREIAIRMALGADRWRIVRQLLTENIILAAAGGALGLLLAVQGVSALKSFLPADTPRLAEVAVDWRVLVFAAALVLATSILFGLAPALATCRSSSGEALKAGGERLTSGGNRLLQSALVSVEVGLAFVIAVAAGLLVKSLWTLSGVNPGFQRDYVLVARLTPNESFCEDFGRCQTLFRDVLDKVQVLPDVKTAALVNTLPLTGRVAPLAVKVENYVPPTGETPLFWENVITPDYLSLMGIQLLRGRPFTESDSSGSPPVVLISASTAKQFWPNQDPIGQHIAPAWTNTWWTIVGIVGDVREYDLKSNVPDWMVGQIYVPYSPAAILETRRLPSQMTLVVRTKGPQRDVGERIPKIVQSLNGDVPVDEIRSMSAVVSMALSEPTSTAGIFIIFGSLALILSFVGVYGVIAYSVSRRTQEIGLRMALGAQRTDILRLILGQGAKLIFLGLAFGALAAFALMRLIASLLFGVSPADFMTFVVVAVVLVCAGFLACLAPAGRAMRVDPLLCMRYE